MTDGELKKLKAYYGALLEQKRQLDVAAEQLKHGVVESPQYGLIMSEIARVIRDFPGLLEALDPNSLAAGHSQRGQPYYSMPGLRAYLAIALSRIEAEMESDTRPVIERRTFLFIADPALRAIVERDFEEAERAWVSRCWKSTIILSGGVIEAILLDLLRRDEPRARTAASAPTNSDLLRWDLADLIAVALELKLVSPGIEKLSQSVREFRNLVHPGREVRQQIAFETEEARIALDVVNILYRELK